MPIRRSPQTGEFSTSTFGEITTSTHKMGYVGAYTAVKRYLAAIRPEHDPKPYEVRFETRAGVQAQVDFARFVVEFTDEPGLVRIVWLFGLVLGYSRFLFARYVLHHFNPIKKALSRLKAMLRKAGARTVSGL